MESITEPEQQYALHFGLESAYPLQAVMGGSAELAGSERDAMNRAMEHAQASKQTFGIHAVSREKDTIPLAINPIAPEQAMLVAALAEDAMVSILQRGENAGHTLDHFAAERVLKAVGVD